jgi:hypothetical protein
MRNEVHSDLLTNFCPKRATCSFSKPVCSTFVCIYVCTCVCICVLVCEYICMCVYVCV